MENVRFPVYIHEPNTNNLSQGYETPAHRPDMLSLQTIAVDNPIHILVTGLNVLHSRAY